MNNSTKAMPTFDDLLKTAQGAVSQLAGHGCVPRSISITGGKPLIVIDPPRDHAFLAGVQHVRKGAGQMVQRAVMAAPFFGCQIEWEVCSLAIQTRH
ncbi:hypothetical protein WMR10_001366 [Stenotrophomonas maltophilia]|uniref:hypothetical protein n=1 Tax=Stenotrophomonas maltophilia TaxID=40324 RepID=UPI0015DDED8A|nr:hypothetical protein [Stenotrophomonas maltophilia]